MSQIEKISWAEFKDWGMLWFVNRILHTFGLVIVFEVSNKTDEVIQVYPARCKYRGFEPHLEEKGFRNVSKYMKKNCKKLLDEAME